MALHSRHFSLQPLPTRGLADTGKRRQLENGNLGCLRSVQTTPLAVKKMRHENEADGHWQLSWRGERPVIYSVGLSAGAKGGRGGLQVAVIRRFGKLQHPGAKNGAGVLALSVAVGERANQMPGLRLEGLLVVAWLAGCLAGPSGVGFHNRASGGGNQAATQLVWREGRRTEERGVLWELGVLGGTDKSGFPSNHFDTGP